MTAVLDATDLLAHRALLYAHDEQLTAVTVPFLRAARAGGGHAVVISDHDGLLRDALGPDAADVEFVDPHRWFGTPARTLTAYLVHARERWWPRGPVSLVAEPVWHRRGPAEVREWLRLESLLNLAFARTPSRLLCAYDLRELPAGVAEDVGRTHPVLVGVAGSLASPAFVDPAVFYAEGNRGPLAPPSEPAESYGFAGGDLPGVRAFVQRAAVRRGLSRTRAVALVQSVSEIATYVVRTGGGRGAVRAWREDGEEDGEVVCEVVDGRAGLDDRFLGYFPPSPYRPVGAGMWAVRQLCDLVEVRSWERRAVVRLHMRLAPR